MESPPVGLLQIVVLALIQGITEFLPISSSAHLILPTAFTAWPDQGMAFDVAVHLGTLLAVVAYFRHDLAGIAGSGAALLWRREWDRNLDLALKVCIATVPVVVAGALLKDQIEAHLRTTTVVATATIVFGVALWWADRRRVRDNPDSPWAPSYAQAVLIGAVQALALIPGTSRSGVTIAAALALGFGRRSAARFSFLLAIPTIVGASVLAAIDADAASLSWNALGLGFAIAAASAFLCISAFIRFVDRTGMAPFAIYRVLLGIVLLLL